MKKEDIVYVINDDEVVETTVEDLIYDHECTCMDLTTTPRGVGPRWHIRNETELWTWGVRGNNPKLIDKYETAQGAEDALWDSFIHDLCNACDAPSFWYDREEAEKTLTERLEYRD